MQTEEEDRDLSLLLSSDVLNTMIRFDYVSKNGSADHQKTYCL